MAANIASEKCLPHVGDDGSGSNHKTLDTNEFVHIRRVEVSEVDNVIETQWSCHISLIHNFLLEGWTRLHALRLHRFLASL